MYIHSLLGGRILYINLVITQQQVFYRSSFQTSIIFITTWFFNLTFRNNFTMVPSVIFTFRDLLKRQIFNFIVTVFAEVTVHVHLQTDFRKWTMHLCLQTSLPIFRDQPVYNMLNILPFINLFYSLHIIVQLFHSFYFLL